MLLLLAPAAVNLRGGGAENPKVLRLEDTKIPDSVAGRRRKLSARWRG